MDAALWVLSIGTTVTATAASGCLLFAWRILERLVRLETLFDAVVERVDSLERQPARPPSIPFPSAEALRATS